MNELNTLKSSILQLIKNREDIITAGKVPSFEVYKQIVGELTGLSLVLGEIEDLQRKQNEADNVG